MCGFYQPRIPSLPSTLSLASQTIIVTGGARGIGYTASLQLLRHKASTLILGVRDVQKGKKAAASLLCDEEIKRVNPTARVEVLELDLGRFESVSGFARKVEERGEGVDLLLLNAGINLARWEKTVDGHELLIQTNFLSNALLSLLLLPTLQKSAAPRVTFVSSMGQNFTSISPSTIPPSTPVLAYFDDPAKYSKLHRYPDSKLLVALFVREFANHLHLSSQGGKAMGGGKVVVNCVCPGTVDTTADDNLPFWLRIPMNLNRRFRARTVEDGAAAMLNAAFSHGETSAGKYISNNVISPLAPIAETAYGKEFGEKMWKEVVEECVRINKSCGAVVESYSLL